MGSKILANFKLRVWAAMHEISQPLLLPSGRLNIDSESNLRTLPWSRGLYFVASFS